MEKAPIGVFDSGIGGITVLRHLLSRFPMEEFIYLADTANIPYGDKTPESLTAIVRNIINFFMEKKVKILVMACNTSSAIVLPNISQELTIPVFGVVLPGVCEALNLTCNNKIGVMANEATVTSGVFPSIITALSKELGKRVEVWQSPCPCLVPLIEQNAGENEETNKTIREYLSPLISKGVDTIILGCTHYPLWKDRFERIAGKNITFIDPAIPTVNEIWKWLKDNGEEYYVEDFEDPEGPGRVADRRSPQGGPAKGGPEGAAVFCGAGNGGVETHTMKISTHNKARVSFWTTGDPDLFNNRASAILGQPVVAVQVKLTVPLFQ